MHLQSNKSAAPLLDPCAAKLRQPQDRRPGVHGTTDGCKDSPQMHQTLAAYREVVDKVLPRSGSQIQVGCKELKVRGLGIYAAAILY